LVVTGSIVGTLSTVVAPVAANQGGVEGWLLHFHGVVIYVLIGLLVFGEAGLMVGFFIPGETAVVVGGALAGLGSANLELVMVVVVVCAIVGDSVGFEVGKAVGPWLLARRWLAERDSVDRTVRLLERRGGPAVFLGRFVAFARALIPGLAGMSGMRYRTFLIFNASGGLLWGIGYALLGYVVGLSFGHILTTVGIWSVAVVGAVVLAVVAVHLVRRRRRSRLSPTESTSSSTGEATAGEGAVDEGEGSGRPGPVGPLGPS
jgi:membrane-associated protein